MGKISENMRQLVIEQLMKGKRKSDVCRELGRGHSTIRAIWAKYVKTGSRQNLFRSGRPAIISKMETRLLCRTSKKNPFLTARELGNECGILIKASVDTVRRVLRKAGLYGRIAVKKPFLNKKQIRLRWQWC